MSAAIFYDCANAEPGCGCQQCCTHRKYNATPEIQWSKGFKSGRCTATTVYDVAVDGSGNSYLVGSWRGKTGDPHYAVEKWDSSGTLAWHVVLTLTNVVSEFDDNESGPDAPLHVATDGTFVWVAVSKDFDGGNNLFKRNASDGTAVWAAEIETGIDFHGRIHDIALDSSGRAYLAHGHRFLSSLPAGVVTRVGTDGVPTARFGNTRPGAVGTFNAAFCVTLDASDNVFFGTDDVQGVDCISYGNVVKFTSALALEWVWHGTGNEIGKCRVTHLKATGANLYVGNLVMSDPGGVGSGIVQRWDVTTFPDVQWSRKPETTGCPTTSHIRGLDADATCVIVAICHWAHVWGTSGSLLSSSPHGNEANAGDDDYLAVYNAVASLGACSFIAAGRAVDCASEDEEGRTQSELNCVGGDNDCELSCGEIGPGGGVVVIPTCGALDSIPCGPFNQDGAGAGCLACMADQPISWVRESGTTWTGTATWCCSDVPGVLTITVVFDCNSGTFSATGIIHAAGTTYGPFTFEIRDEGCDVLNGHPWLTGFFTVTEEIINANPEIFACCEGGTGCFGFGAGACEEGVEDCENCPDGAPSQYVVTIAGISDGTCSDCSNANGTHTLNHVAGCTWEKVLDPPVDCGGSGVSKISLLIADNFGSKLMTVSIQSNLETLFVSWNVSDDPFDCFASRTLSLDQQLGSCGTYPSTISVAAA